MRRIPIAVIAAIAATTVWALGPANATAATPHHRAAHHGAHHASKRRHHRRLVVFGTPLPAAATSAAHPSVSPPAPATRPRGDARSGGTALSSGETAGVVKSFEGGVLTLELTDHSTVSGRVAEATELRCESASGEDDQGGEGGPGESARGGADAAVRSSSSGEDGEDVGDHEEPGDGEDEDGPSDGEDEDGPSGGPPPACTTAALVPGAVVAEAELSVGSGGAVWEQVELIL